MRYGPSSPLVITGMPSSSSLDRTITPSNTSGVVRIRTRPPLMIIRVSHAASRPGLHRRPSMVCYGSSIDERRCTPAARQLATATEGTARDAMAVRALEVRDVSPAECCVPLGRASLNERDAEATATVFKALSDPARVRIVNVLANAGKPVCVCDLTPALGLAQATV